VKTPKVTLSHTNKVWFPQSHITKGEIFAYYEKIAPYMLPFIKNRPLTLQRAPNGITGEIFYQKDTPDYFPSWIKITAITKKSGGKTSYITCSKTDCLLYLVNQGCITPHAWLSRTDKPTKPDRMVFDLDPSGKATFKKVKEIAHELKKILEYYHLTSYPMITGSRGIHVIVPIKRLYTFTQVKKSALLIAHELIKKMPDHATLEVRIAKRGNKIFIDTLRNCYAQTGIIPYAVRLYEKAPVAVPLSWDELGKISSAQEYTIKTILKQLKDNPHPWPNFFKKAGSLVAIFKIGTKKVH